MAVCMNCCVQVDKGILEQLDVLAQQERRVKLALKETLAVQEFRVHLPYSLEVHLTSWQLESIVVFRQSFIGVASYGALHGHVSP